MKGQEVREQAEPQAAQERIVDLREDVTREV
jgi:hypothetical protein